MGQRVALQQSKDHGHGDAVVAAQRSAFGVHGVPLHGQLQALGGHILFAVRLFFADHVHVPLQKHRRSGLIAGGSGLFYDHIVPLVLPDGKAAVAGKAHQIVADGLGVAAAVGNAAKLLKPVKDPLGLQTGQNRHKYSSFL